MKLIKLAVLVIENFWHWGNEHKVENYQNSKISSPTNAEVLGDSKMSRDNIERR